MASVSEAKISVIMPAFNESSSIVANVVETVRTLAALRYDFEIIVVDDGSPDLTHLAALRAKVLYPDLVRVVRYDRNQGKGNALSAGVAHSCGEYVVFLDADMDLHPEQLPTFLSILDKSGADAVIGSKLHPESNVDYPILRRMLSLGYYALIRVLFGLPVRDTQTGFKVFRRDTLVGALPFTFARGFSFDVELLAIMHLVGASFAEAPVTLSFQRHAGRLNAWTAFSMLLDTLAIYVRLQRNRSLITHMSGMGRSKFVGKEHGTTLIETVPGRADDRRPLRTPVLQPLQQVV